MWVTRSCRISWICWTSASRFFNVGLARLTLEGILDVGHDAGGVDPVLADVRLESCGGVAGRARDTTITSSASSSRQAVVMAARSMVRSRGRIPTLCRYPPSASPMRKYGGHG